MYSYPRGDVLKPEHEISLGSMKRTSQAHCQVNGTQSCGSMMSLPFMRMIAGRLSGYSRRKQHFPSRREKALHRWWLTWLVLTTGGCIHVMENMKHECSSRQERIGRDTLPMTISWSKPTKQWISLKRITPMRTMCWFSTMQRVTRNGQRVLFHPDICRSLCQSARR